MTPSHDPPLSAADSILFSRAELADGFRRLGVAAGDTVMLHASIRSVGPVAGGPDQIHLALKEALTESGTLMMYAGCPDHYDEVGLGHLPPELEAELVEKLPPFDGRTARAARDNGALVELLRSYPGSLANDHVCRFTAWGRGAPRLLSSQPWSYAYGRGSALERFHDAGGKILLLGCDHDHVTFLHHVEHVAEIPGRIVVRFRVPIIENGVRVWREMEEYDTAERAHPAWPDRFFAKLVDAYLAETGNPGGLVGKSPSFLLDARGLAAFASGWMKAIAADPGAVSRLEPRG